MVVMAGDMDGANRYIHGALTAYFDGWTGVGVAARDYVAAGMDALANRGNPTATVLGAKGRSGKDIYIGGKKVNQDVFHREIKPEILGKANPSKYSQTVGRNPDIKIVNGKVVLEGQGPYRGKTYETGLSANDFFK